MKFIAKYGIGIYFIISLLFKLHFIIPVTLVNSLFYILMVLGILLFSSFFKLLLKTKYKKSFGVLYSIVIINLIYIIVFNYNTESAFYVLSKFSTTNLITFGIITNYQFYEKFIQRYFNYIIYLLLIFGYFFSDPGEYSEGVQRM